MKKLKHFETPQAVIDYIASEFVSTLQDDYDRMTNDPHERKHYSNEDRADMRGKLADVKALADLLPGIFDTLEEIAGLKTEEEYEDGDAPPSEDWITALNERIANAREAIGQTKKGVTS